MLNSTLKKSLNVVLLVGKALILAILIVTFRSGRPTEPRN